MTEPSVRAEIEALYLQYNPDKIPEIDTLLAKYGDRKLLSMIRRKYVTQQQALPINQSGLDSFSNAPQQQEQQEQEHEQQPKTSHHREQIEALYARFNPEKLVEVDKLVNKYGEIELLRMVRKSTGTNYQLIQYPTLEQRLSSDQSHNGSLDSEVQRSLYSPHRGPRLNLRRKICSHGH